MRNIDQVLVGYEAYMHKHRLAKKDQIPFMVKWVKRFLLFARNHRGKSFEEVYELFAAALGSDESISNWRLRQAMDSVRIYGYQFRQLPPHSGTLFSAFQGYHNVGPVLTRLRELMRLRHYSYRTEKAYLQWVRRFLAYCAQTGGATPPGEIDVKAFLTHLALEQDVSVSTQNQAFNALLLLCREVLGVDLTDMGRNVRAKRGRRIPVVLSVDEVTRLLDELQPRHRLMIELLYGAGLRLMELLRLRVKDVDFDNGVLVVRRGKGDRDRTTVLPHTLVDPLRIHLETVKEIHEADLLEGHGEVYLPGALVRKYPNTAYEWQWQWVFPTQNLSVDPRTKRVRRHHLKPRYIQKAMKQAVKEAGLVKHVSVHTLRHSFATHLLLQGTDIREIQELLGHKNVETTMIYTHVVRDLRAPSVSPLDRLRREDR